ncbi:BTH_I0359 family protein [Rubrivivax sp. RP6-9]|uniref:BTH_I0359 family protein n=1 Tax=Rubrivivax sp. RP6-9 TaxID=3415750 RepID=UPI003CC6BB5B
MQMLYNSDCFTVVQFDVADGALSRGGYEIVDKVARRGIFLEGAIAEHFEQGVQALVDGTPSAEDFDSFIEGYTAFSPQPLRMH